MRHKIAGNKLSRNQTLRKATLRDLAKATLIRQRICTTKAKAKEARRLVEKLITLGKKGTLASKRRAFSILCDHNLVSDLFNKTSLRFKNRIGGYTRIITLGQRRGDNAQLVYLELTEKEEIVVNPPKEKSAKKAQPADAHGKGHAKLPAQPVKESKKESRSASATAVEEEALHEEKEKSAKKDFVKDPKASHVNKDTAKHGGKGIVGNIKKIFNRKTSA